MAKHTLILNRHNRRLAREGLDKAKDGYVLELREPTRSDAQNDALHGLIDQIIKQRPTHNGIRMDKALWKATFMYALGEEVRFVPTLEGDGVFPIGLRTSSLGKERFGELMEFILAWSAREGLTIEHFDEPSPQSSTPGSRQPEKLAAVVEA